VQGGESAAPSDWQPFARANASIGFDSNVAREAGAIQQVSNREAATLNASVTGGIANVSGVRPVSAFGFASLQTAFNDRDSRGTLAGVESFMTSSLGAAATGRMELGPIVGALDARYSAVFVETFQTYIGSQISPSLSGSWQVHPLHRLRLLAGTDIFVPDLAGTSANPTIHASLWDSMGLGPVSVTVSAGYRFNVNSQDALTANTGFNEVGGLVYAEYSPLDDFDIFAAFDGRGRFFEADAAGAGTPGTEGTLTATAGLRYTIGFVELHATYGFTANLADVSTREYTRHQLNGGVRFWYP